MSATQPEPGCRSSPVRPAVRRLTVSDIARLHADGRRIAMLTAYDYPTARLLDEAGHPAPARRRFARPGHPRLRERDPGLDGRHAPPRQGRRPRRAGAPWSSATCRSCPTRTPEQAVQNAGRFLAEAGVQAVKLEGGRRSARTIEAITRAGIPVMGHIGLTPQSINQIGRLRVQGKTREAGRELLADALAVQEAGRLRRSSSSSCRSSSPPRSPSGCASRRSASAPGAGCSGQVQVLTDLLGYEDVAPAPRPAVRGPPRHDPRVPRRAYRADVEAGTFPGPAETVRMDDEVIDEILGQSVLDRPSRSIPAGGIPLDRDL